MNAARLIPPCVLLLACATAPLPAAAAAPEPVVLAALHTYEARIRFEGKLSTTQVKASDAGHAKKLVQQQFPKATVLSVKRID